MLFLATLAATLALLQAQSSCDQCQFDGNNATDCKDYGKLDSTRLKAWSLGSDDCKDVWNWNIAITSVDPTMSCSLANAFVNAIKLGSLSASSTRLGLGVGSEGGAFFVQDPDNSNSVTLASSVQIDGVTTDCVVSSSDCSMP
jgi:hypothetical protein